MELVRRIKEAFPAYERLVRYWPQKGPLLAGALGEACMHGGDAIIRQCGLSTSQELGSGKGRALLPPLPQAERSARRSGKSVAGGSGKGGESLRSAVGSAVGSKVGSFLGLSNARSSNTSLPPPDHCKCAPNLPDVALSLLTHQHAKTYVHCRGEPSWYHLIIRYHWFCVQQAFSRFRAQELFG